MPNPSEHDAPQGAPWIVPPELDGATVAAAVRELLGCSWSRARACVERAEIEVGGAPVTDATARVRAGDALVHSAGAPRSPVRPLGSGRLVHLDPHLVVVDKPPGLLTTPTEGRQRGTLIGELRQLLARTSRPGPRRRGAMPSLLAVHRLDRDASGLVVFARSMAAREALAEQFREHTVHRRYLALAHGDVGARTHRSHLVPDRGDGRRGSRERLPGPSQRRAGPGKLAVTHVEPIERLAKATLIACRLETGRTNQIRIHLAEDAHPLLGETIYFRGSGTQRIDAPRLMLHAAQLGFDHPVTGQPLSFERELPADFQRTLRALRKGGR